MFFAFLCFVIYFPFNAALNMLIVCVVKSNSHSTSPVYTTSESELADGCVDVGLFRGYARELRDTVDDTYEDFVSNLHNSCLV